MKASVRYSAVVLVAVILFAVAAVADCSPDDFGLGRQDAKFLGHRRIRNLAQMPILRDDARFVVKVPSELDRANTNTTLIPFELEPLPLGSIKPRGWMKDQLQLMADGLPGHLHEFYRLTKQGEATWLGGDQEYSRLNEAWPYWYNGVVALAYGLDDDRLKSDLADMTKYVLDHQISDGWFGPETDVTKRNFWGRYPFLLGLMQLIEVSQPAQSTKILDSIHHFVVLMHGMLANNSQGYISHAGDDFDEQWGRSRAADMVIFLQWLYEKHPRDNAQLIYDCMANFHDGSYDWSYWFRSDVFYTGDFDTLNPDVRGPVFPYIHGVNAGQGLKYGAVMRRLTRLDKYVASTKQGVDLTMQYHGAPSGAVVGDEGLSGQSPTRGAELCSVVETVYSLTYNYQVLGDKSYAERAELAAFNALPVMHTPDYWAHQYIATANQPISQRIDSPPFWNVGPLGTTFGTEPNYPCCAVNHPQGYPKFLSASFTKRGSNGIAHAFLMPAQVNTTLADDKPVSIRCDTSYPFGNSLVYTIDSGSSFAFSFRVPSWATGYTVMINGEKSQAFTYDDHTGLATIDVSSGTTTLEVTLVTTPRVETRPNSTVAVHYGALLYALPVQADYTSTTPEHYPTGAPEQARDYTIRPRDDAIWNVAIDPSTVAVRSGNENSTPASLANPIWTVDAPPTRLTAMACQVANWNLTSPEGGYAAPIPPEDQRQYVGVPFEVELQPYGALKVHIAEFPTFNVKDSSSEAMRTGGGQSIKRRRSQRLDSAGSRGDAL